MANVLPKAGVRGGDMADTRVTSEPLAELPQPPSRRPYGAGDAIDGRYVLEALLGRGGMGEVWTARNDTLGVRRAVKLIRADSGSAESTDRLLHEARAAATLADPAIVRVFDFGTTSSGDPYIVMELLEGEDLMSVISRRERLSPIKAARVLLPMIRALSAAHGQGIVHRDLKPENIFLSKMPDGRVQPKLLDFGIAKLKNARELRLTTAGSVVGSPLYMAPEQARGEDVDERADIWALCVVLYEAITGCPPFGGDDRAQVMHAVGALAPRSLAEHGVTDASLWPIIRRGLEKEKGDRWQSMQELGRTLARWLLDTGVSDDITGASLEAGWFRSSRQSLFASSMPPDRRLGTARRALFEGVRRGRVLFTLLGTRGVQRLLWLWRLDPLRRLGLVLGFGAVVAGVVAASSGAAPESVPVVPVATTAVPAVPAIAAPAAPVAPLPSDPPGTAPGETARAESPRVEGSRATRLREVNRTPRRKPARAGASAVADTAKEKRRSKLIDPYR